MFVKINQIDFNLSVFIKLRFYLEIKPLCMPICVNVILQDAIIFIV